VPHAPLSLIPFWRTANDYPVIRWINIKFQLQLGRQPTPPAGEESIDDRVTGAAVGN